ncbi:MAG: hypothetical protein ACP5GX_09730 [Anaerolineae bacterium]
MRTLGLTLMVLAVLTLVACGGTSSETPQGEVLLEERCTECHALDRVTQVEQTRAEWQATVEDMIARGATLNDEEKGVLVDYLAENYGP